jgi:hypothetical protein
METSPKNPVIVCDMHHRQNPLETNRICIGYIERTSVGNTECPFVCLHSVALVLGDSPCEKIEQIFGPCLAGASLTKPATLLGISRETVSEVMSAYTNPGKTTSAKSNSGRNSTLTERDRRTLRRIVSENHRTTEAQVTGEQN